MSCHGRIDRLNTVVRTSGVVVVVEEKGDDSRRQRGVCVPDV